MEYWQIWILVSLLLFILEVFTPGFVLASLGIGALSGAGFAFMGFGLTVQLSCFALASLVVFFAVRPTYLAYLNRYDENLPTGVKAMEGKQVRVLETIQGHASEAGRIKYAGETWRALTENGDPIEVDSRVVIERVDGATVWVRPIEEE